MENHAVVMDSARETKKYCTVVVFDRQVKVKIVEEEGRLLLLFLFPSRENL